DSSISLIQSLQCADLVVDARTQSPSQVFQQCNQGLGCDAVLILPESQKAFDYAAPLARKGGEVCIVSFPVGGFRISSHEVVFRDVRIRGGIPSKYLAGSLAHILQALFYCVCMKDLWFSEDSWFFVDIA